MACFISVRNVSYLISSGTYSGFWTAVIPVSSILWNSDDISFTIIRGGKGNGSQFSLPSTYEDYKAYIRRSALEAYIEKINNDPDSPYSLSIKGHYAAGTVITIDGKEYTNSEDFYILKRDYGGLSNSASYVIVPDSSNGIIWSDEEGDNTFINMFSHNGTVNGSPNFSKEPTVIFHSELDIVPYGGSGGGDTGGGSTGGGDTGGGSTGGGDTGGGSTGGGDTGGGDTGGGDTIIIGDGNTGEGNGSNGYGEAINWFPSTELIQSITHLNNAITAKIGVDIAATITAARINAVANQQKIGIFYIPLQGIWVNAPTQYVEINIYKYANEDFVIIIRRMLAVLIFLTTAIIILTVLRQY
jgi:hypothetical protein